MTNGEKIKEVFPSTDSRLDEKTGIMLVKWVDGTTKCFKADWWNAEYKEPKEEEIHYGISRGAKEQIGKSMNTFRGLM